MKMGSFNNLTNLISNITPKGELSIATNVTELYEKDTGFKDTLNSSNIPSSFKEISELSRNCVIAYSILFIMAATGNIKVFCSVIKKMRHNKSRISLLILHLSIADLLVTFFAMPMEINWRITIQWYGGDILCKFCQFSRAFGLYLSSMIVICISVDRYFAIIYPMKLVGAAKRVNTTLVFAWIGSVIFALPQVVVFKVMSHPEFPSFHQCVTETFFRSEEEQELLYNVFSVTVLYFIPLSVIIFTYLRILCKIYQKSKARKEDLFEDSHKVAVSFTGNKIPSEQQARKTVKRGNIHEGMGIEDYTMVSPNNELAVPTTSIKFHLRTSMGGGLMMARARKRTLRLTCIIVLTFILCWTPYVVMTLWYMFDREGAKNVDGRIQEALFIMVLFNSVLDPLIYGTCGGEARPASGVKNYCCKRGLNFSPKEQLNHRRRSTLGNTGTNSMVLTHACDLYGYRNRLTFTNN